MKGVVLFVCVCVLSCSTATEQEYYYKPKTAPIGTYDVESFFAGMNEMWKAYR